MPHTPSAFPKIDIHCHTTDRILKNAAYEHAGLAVIEENMMAHDIRYTVLLATYFPKKQSGVSNFRLRSWIDGFEHYQDNDFNCQFLMFGSLDFEHYFNQGLGELEELARSAQIRGIKLYAGYQNMKKVQILKVLLLAQKYRLPVMIHTGDCTKMNGVCANIASFDWAVECFEDVKFIYSHMNNPHIEQVTERIQRYPNAYTDMSGLIHSGKDDHEIPELVIKIRKHYDACGMSQFLWGTDFPVQTYEHSILFAEHALHGYASLDELRQFYYGNAAKLLGIL